MFVYGDVVYAQTWQLLTLKNCLEPFSYANMAYVVASALVSVRLFYKNLGNLQNVFGQMVYRPHWQKIARTPMVSLMLPTKLPDMHFLYSFYASKLMSITVLLSHLSYGERPGRQFVKHLVCYESGTSVESTLETRDKGNRLNRN